MQTDIHYCATGTERHGHGTNTKWDIFSNAPASGCNSAPFMTSGHLYIYIYVMCLYVSGCTLNTWHWHRDVIKLLMSVRTSEEFMYVYYMQTLSAPAFSGWTDKKSLDETFGLVIFYFLYRRKCFQFHFLQVIFRGTIKTFQAVGRFYVF